MINKQKQTDLIEAAKRAGIREKSLQVILHDKPISELSEKEAATLLADFKERDLTEWWATLKSHKRGWAVPGIKPTGIFIQDYLLEHGEGYPMEIWRALKKVRGSIKVSTYQSFQTNYIWVLKKLGLIEKIRTTPASNPKFYDRIYYRITLGKEKSRKWVHPQKSLDPRRSLGSKKYKKKSSG